MYKLCIIGLGNPGSKYDQTRHNIGKDWILKISNKFFKEFTNKIKFEAQIGKSHNDNILWIIPSNYVNNSGNTIKKIIRSTNINAKNLLVIHDELDLYPGDIRFKEGGGHGGHNGLKDIIEKIGTNDFNRIRVGIGHPGSKEEVSNWVLTKFSPSEEQSLNKSFKRFEEVFDMICENQIEKVQKILHTK